MQQPPFFHQVLELGGEFIVRGLTKKQFGQLTLQNPDWRMERETNGEILIMSPVKGGRLFLIITKWHILKQPFWA